MNFFDGLFFGVLDVIKKELVLFFLFVSLLEI